MRIHRFVVAFLLLFAIVIAPVAPSHALDVNVSIDLFSPPPVAVAPPPLPVYVVPPPPMPGYIWAPGHWRWGGVGYFWVPGTWVAPPAIGVLWTPGYWGWANGAFLWHEGYWAPHVGFYGGVNYGGGYNGVGFAGGGWNNGFYVVNRSFVNVTNVTNVSNVTYPSFNGGPGGVVAGPTAQERAFAKERHMPPTSEQVNHIRTASADPTLSASRNHGKPAIAATPRAGMFRGAGVIGARQAGPANPEAEKHNAAIRQNPALARGAALPRYEGTHEEAAPQREHEEQARPREEHGEQGREEGHGPE